MNIDTTKVTIFIIKLEKRMITNIITTIARIVPRIVITFLPSE